jgi:hypothetical protein
VNLRHIEISDHPLFTREDQLCVQVSWLQVIDAHTYTCLHTRTHVSSSQKIKKKKKTLQLKELYDEYQRRAEVNLAKFYRDKVVALVSGASGVRFIVSRVCERGGLINEACHTV